MIFTQVQGLPPRQAERGPGRGAARARCVFGARGPRVEGVVGVRPREMARRLEADPGGGVAAASSRAASRNVVVTRQSLTEVCRYVLGLVGLAPGALSFIPLRLPSDCWLVTSRGLCLLYLYGFRDSSVLQNARKKNNLVIVIVAARDPCVSVSKCKRQCKHCSSTVLKRCGQTSECIPRQWQLI